MSNFLTPVKSLNVAVPARPPAVLGGSGQSSDSLPGFRMQGQQQNEWCWAAVSASTSDFYDPAPWTQCKIATAELTQACCVAPPASVPAACDVPWSLDTALLRIGHLKQFLQGHEAFADVQQEIKMRNPIGARIAWSQGGGHFVAVGGWLLLPNGDQYLDIFDPLFGDTQVAYGDFVSSYRSPGDTWTHSYRTASTTAVVATGGTKPLGPSPISA